MPLKKQAIDVSFAQGLDTKPDPFRIPLGKFSLFQNSQFGITGQLTKRDGFGALPALPVDSSIYLTTFNGDATAIGEELYAFNPGGASWINKGDIFPVNVTTLPLIHDNINQSQCDAAISRNNLVCTVYTQSDGSTTSYKYVIADPVTGQNIVAPTSITPSSGALLGSPRVFSVGNFFVIVFTTIISTIPHLQYMAVNQYSLNVRAAADITTAYDAVATTAWDGIVTNDTLYLAWNAASSGGIEMAYIDSTMTLFAAQNVDAAHVGSVFALCADETGSTPIIYVVYGSYGSSCRVLAVNPQLVSVLASTQFSASLNVLNFACTAQNGSVTIFSEIDTAYSFDSAIKSNFISKRTVTVAGSVGSTTTVRRSVGLASKAFLNNGDTFFLSVYQSTYQPTYFLLRSDGVILAELAYENGGGYLPAGLPLVSVDGTTARVAYLFKDLLTAVNKNTNVAAGNQTAGIYSQLGINLATFSLSADEIISAETARNLHISGGFLYMYDGYIPVEHGFFLWPDVYQSGVVILTDPTKTGNTLSGNATITSMSSVTNLTVGMNVSGTGIQAGSVITAIGTTTITLSKTASASNNGVTLTFTGNLSAQIYYYQVTYEWTDNQGNAFKSAPSIPVTVTASAGHTSTTLQIPTLRLTYKTANPVKICIYRWSTAQQTYYQTTSIVQPVLNSTTTDSITYIDINSDATILGNNILYTTGGVLENIGAPACDSMDLFDTRLWLIDGENKDLLWFSKQVVQGEPVEFSDLLTVYVSPNAGSEGPTGPMRCLAPMDDKQCIFKKNAIYYINGKGPDNTGANSQYSEPTFITSTVGCDNQNSIVLTPLGLMFQSDKGIWLLSRELGTRYIGADVQEFNDAVVLSALTVPGTNQVRFTLDNGVTLMYDYYYDQWGSFVGVPAVSSTLYQDLHTCIDQFGRVFQQTVGQYLDGSNPVLMAFTTAWVNPAGLQGYQRAYFFNFLATYLSPHKLSIGIAYDYAPSPEQFMVVSPPNYSPPWGADSTWGAGTPWGGPQQFEQWQINFKKQQCQAFQISIQEVFDSSYGTVAGPGLTMSGLNLVVGLKKGYSPIQAARSMG